LLIFEEKFSANNMFRFENEEYLWLLLLIPLLALLFIWFLWWQRKAKSKFGDRALVQKLMPSYISSKLWLKFLLNALALALIIVGLANPQMGSKLEKVERQGIDVIVALDVSRSMLAEDLTPNRLDVSKRIVSKLIDRLGNDRVGLIVFAGSAYLQMPLTIDYSAAKLFLRTIDTDMIPSQGTALGQAINLAKESFDQDATKYKALVLITDGENHENGALDAAKEAKEQGVIIHTMGIGSDVGAPIPEFNSRKQRVGYKKDKNGEVVNSKLEEKILRQIADVTEGDYLRANGTQGEVTKIVATLANMEKKDFEDRVFTDYEDQFQYFMGGALLLLLISFLLSEKRSPWMTTGTLFERN